MNNVSENREGVGLIEQCPPKKNIWQLSKVRKIAIVMSYLSDVLLHAALVFGWSSISELLRKDGFFVEQSIEIGDDENFGMLGANDSSAILTQEDASQNVAIARLMTIVTSLLGALLLLHGFVRDYMSYGLCRIETYIILAVSYLLMGISTPGNTDILQYFWIFQMGSGIGIFLNGLQFVNLFPNHVGSLIGLSNAFVNLSSIFPQAWLTAVNNGYLSFSQILYIWMAITIASLTFGIFIFPWHNLPQEMESSTCDPYATLVNIAKSKRPLLASGGENPSLAKQIVENIRFLRSPMFIVHLVMFTAGNCIVTFSLNVANDIIGVHVNDDDFDETQRDFEIMRVAVATLICPIIGIVTDVSMKYWKRTESKAKDVQKVLIAYVAILLANSLFTFSLFGSNLWLTLVSLGFINGLVYTFETIGISVNFPISSQGIIFALVELFGSLFNFVQIPITDAVKRDGNLDAFNYFTLSMLFFIICCGPVIVLIAFKSGNSCLNNLDKDRSLAINNIENDNLN